MKIRYRHAKSSIFRCVVAVVFVSASLPVTTQALQIWANTGEDKVVQSDLRANNNPQEVINSVWDGTRINLFGARNETVSFCLILESPDKATRNVSVELASLNGPGGSRIISEPTTGDGVFNWLNRPIELFYVRYLPIKGLGRLMYESYDERHVPERFRRPFTGEGNAVGGTGWTDRPDHDAYYPDIAVPLELETPFTIEQGKNQCIWVDIYIPKTSPAGRYTGIVTVNADSGVTNVPLQLAVRRFTLADENALPNMVYVGYEDVNRRYVDPNDPYPSEEPNISKSKRVLDRHFQLAHRHRVSLIGAEGDLDDRPHPNFDDRFSGALFTPSKGYAGVGQGTGNTIYSIGTYGSWSWQNDGEAAMHTRTNAWVNWFERNAATTDYFLYLTDESDDYPQIEQWANWIESNPGAGKRMTSFATLELHNAVDNTPTLNMPCAAVDRATADVVENAANSILSDPAKTLCYYNGWRPGSGSFSTEDDGVAIRTTSWAQFKKGIQRWFFWESTYYNNFQGGTGQTDVFNSGHTFGGITGNDPVFGETGWNYSNGDGVLFYPGTDKIFPGESYGLEGPIASLRLKHWRRGIQDGEYLTLARAINPDAVDAIVQRMVPKVLWEYGVTEPSDPTYVLTDISWSTDPDVWEEARRQLADIIDNQQPEPALSIEVLTNGNDADQAPGVQLQVGAVIEWKYEVTNTGTTTLNQVRVYDRQGAPTPSPWRLACTIATLAPGAKDACTRQGSATAGLYRRDATAQSFVTQDRRVIDNDPSYYQGGGIDGNAAISIDLKTNGEQGFNAPGVTVTPGSDIKWTYMATNTGDVPLQNVRIFARQGAPVQSPWDLICVISVLNPGASDNCESDDVAGDSLYRRDGTAQGLDSRGTRIINNDRSFYTPR